MLLSLIIITHFSHSKALLIPTFFVSRFQVGSWTEIEDSWSFFRGEISKAVIETMFGSTLLKIYPALLRDYWAFDTHIEKFSGGLPRFLMSPAYTARDRLHENLQKWIKTVDGGSDLAKIADEDAVWDPEMGSKYWRGRDEIIAKIPTLDYRARAGDALINITEYVYTLSTILF